MPFLYIPKRAGPPCLIANDLRRKMTKPRWISGKRMSGSGSIVLALSSPEKCAKRYKKSIHVTKIQHLQVKWDASVILLLRLSITCHRYPGKSYATNNRLTILRFLPLLQYSPSLLWRWRHAVVQAGPGCGLNSKHSAALSVLLLERIRSHLPQSARRSRSF